jgi:uncharacterized membrane protein
VGERLFELLFKYRPVVFEQGSLALGASRTMVVAALVAALLAAYVIVRYARVAGGGRLATALALVRLGVLTLLLVALLRPVLIVRSVEPQRNFLGILLDDSRSMEIADGSGRSRGQLLQATFAPDSPVIKSLQERFSLRFFRFSSSTARTNGSADLTFSGTRTELAQALTGARDELAGVPLSGLIVATDGADNAGAAMTATLRALRAAAVPVFTVGYGRAHFDKDVQLSRISAPMRVLKGASLLIDVVVTQNGYAGRTVPIFIEDDGRIVGQKDVTFAADGEPATVRVPYSASEKGPRLLRFRVPEQPGEMVTQNNAREVLIDVVDRTERILYIEGGPRFEMKFIRRAVADDKNLHVVVFQRTAENKYLRLDVADADELLEGFPKTRDEMFAYRALILGSIEAGFFTPDQLRMIADFVSVRGGGLLALGGRHSFAEGGYADTPVADALPVLFEPTASEEPFFSEVKVRPTRAGATHAATQIAETEEASSERWSTLPPLTIVNPIRQAKPGATVLLTGEEPSGHDTQVVLAYQRYGAGKSLALTVQDSWLWQMHADIAVDDMTHETLWRRVLRWLVDDVPDRVMTSASRDRVEPGEALTLNAAVRDKSYLEVNNGQVSATIIGPDGEQSLPMDWAVDRDGQYQARFVPESPGLYEVKTTAVRGEESLGGDTTYFRVAPSDAEYFDAGMRAPLLRRVAEETGGRFYTADQVDGLAKDVQYAGGGVTVVDEKELWDMPVVLLLFVVLVGAEWTWRRRRGWA